MRKGKYIAELTAAQAIVDCVFAVKNPALSEKSGKRRATLKLADRTGDLDAILWDASDSQWEMLRSAPYVLVCGDFVEASDRFPRQIKITGVQAHRAEPGDEDHFLAPHPGDHDATLQRFADLRGRVGNAHLADLLSRVFDKEGFWLDFTGAVAAGSHHHAFRGGLLRHTVEVGELCRAACDVLPFLRHDLLIAGALLHDVGKVAEMEHGPRAGTYTALGSLVGHVHHGAFLVQFEIARDRSFPKGLKEALTHLLLAHHDRPEWGSPREPALPEAIVLALCDRISAHATEASDAYDAARGSGQVSVRRGDRWICVADLGLDALDLRGLDAPVSVESHDLSLPSFLLSRGKEGARVLAPGETAVIPLRGLVAAGDGERSAAFPEDTGEACTIVVPPGGADYLVRVTGESMIDAGILPGDQAYVRFQETARHGDIVIAYVPTSGSVVKRYTESPMGCFLHSENPDRTSYPPIPVTTETRIQGVVTRVERNFIGR